MNKNELSPVSVDYHGVSIWIYTSNDRHEVHIGNICASGIGPLPQSIKDCIDQAKQLIDSCSYPPK